MAPKRTRSAGRGSSSKKQKVQPPGDGVDDNEGRSVLNVSMVDTKDGTSKVRNRIPIGDSDFFSEENLNKTKLSKIRQLLVKKKALTLSRFGCAFCSADGAEVNDKTSLKDYLDLVGTPSTTPKAKKAKKAKKNPSVEAGDKNGEEEENNNDDNKEEDTDTGEKERNAKFTEYTVYLQEKRKYEVDKDVLKIVDEDLDLDLNKNRPKLPKMERIKHLESSYDPDSVVAKSGSELPNPAQMSEKDWHSVIRINSVLNAHRLAFTQSRKADDSEGETLQFRRIERAPYNAFEIKPRNFGLWEVSNDVTKSSGDSETSDSERDDETEAEVSLRIPRYVVEDESYVNVFETQSALETAMASSSFSQTEIKGGIGGGAFGYSAAISAGFSQQETKALSDQKAEEHSTINITYNFPRVVLHLDSESVMLTAECKKALQEVLDSGRPSKVLKFHQSFGHFFATRVELGGRLFSAESKDLLGVKTTSQAAKAMKLSANAAFSSPHVKGSIKASKEDQNASSESTEERELARAISWQAQGGNTLLCNNPPEWVPTVAPFTNWRVVKQEDVIPLVQYIGQIPKYHYVPEAFAAIMRGDGPHNPGDSLVPKFKIPIKFKHVLKDRDTESYLNFQTGSQGIDRLANELHRARPGSRTAKTYIPAPIFKDRYQTQCQENGMLKGFLDLTSQDDSTDFEIQANTYVGGVPMVLWNKWYKVYNKKHKQFLSTVSVGSWNAFALGDEKQACYLIFRSGKDKPDTDCVKNGDIGTLLIKTPKDVDLGELCIAKGGIDARTLTPKQSFHSLGNWPDWLQPCDWKFEIGL